MKTETEKQLYYANLFAHSCEPILLIDPYANRIQEANPAACQLLEYDQAQLLDTKASELFGDKL